MGGVASKGLSCGERWEAEAGIQVKPEDTGFPLRSQDLEVKYHMVWETLDALKSVPYMEGVFEKSQSWGGRVGEWGVEKGSLICGLCNAFCIILHQAFHTITVNIFPLIHIFFFRQHLLTCTVSSWRVEITFPASPYPPLLAESLEKCSRPTNAS